MGRPARAARGAGPRPPAPGRLPSAPGLQGDRAPPAQSPACNPRRARARPRRGGSWRTLHPAGCSPAGPPGRAHTEMGRGHPPSPGAWTRDRQAPRVPAVPPRGRRGRCGVPSRPSRARTNTPRPGSTRTQGPSQQPREPRARAQQADPRPSPQPGPPTWPRRAESQAGPAPPGAACLPGGSGGCVASHSTLIC